MDKQNNKDLTEIFGYSPKDLTRTARSLWSIGACPFTKQKCIKHNHDQTIIYGTCSVHSSGQDVIICPNRLYANDYQSIKAVAEDAFGKNHRFFTFEQYVENRNYKGLCVVALGQNSGKEIKIGRALSMDWILALINNGELVEYVGVEVQSIDITGNYRDAWHAYKNLKPGKLNAKIPSSGHGLNWANVHKRLIPQLIRKGLVYSRSQYVKSGLYFIAPDAVYKKFEGIIGEIPLVTSPKKNTITVHTYSLGPNLGFGKHRALILERKLCFSLKEFSERFISGATLPSGHELDTAVKSLLELK